MEYSVELQSLEASRRFLFIVRPGVSGLLLFNALFFHVFNGQEVWILGGQSIIICRVHNSVIITRITITTAGIVVYPFFTFYQ